MLAATAQGEPALFVFDGGSFLYSGSLTRARQLIGLKATAPLPIPALAVGDLDGDGLNDLAIARSGRVEFYLGTETGFVRSPSDLTLPGALQAAAMAIGQADGAGKNDLVIAEPASVTCGPASCSVVHIFQNQTP